MLHVPTRTPLINRDSMTYEHIDADRIKRLARDLVGDVNSCVRFVDDYVGASASRIARVQHAIDNGRLEDALTSLLSLASSSAMVGAESLARVARELHAEATRSGSLPARAAEYLEWINAASCAELADLTAPWRVAA
jgi:hypothetical protein